MGMMGWTVSYGWMDAQKSRTVSIRRHVCSAAGTLSTTLQPYMLKLQYCNGIVRMGPGLVHGIRTSGRRGYRELQTWETTPSAYRFRLAHTCTFFYQVRGRSSICSLKKSAEDYCSLRKHLPVFGNICDVKLSEGIPLGHSGQLSDIIFQHPLGSPLNCLAAPRPKPLT